MNTTENCWKNLMKDTISKYLNEGEKAAPVLGFDDYYVTSTGRVFSSKTKFEYQTLDKVNYGCIAWKELKPTIVRGYKTVNLSNRNVRKNFIFISWHGLHLWGIMQNIILKLNI